MNLNLNKKNICDCFIDLESFTYLDHNICKSWWEEDKSHQFKSMKRNHLHCFIKQLDFVMNSLVSITGKVFILQIINMILEHDNVIFLEYIYENLNYLLDQDFWLKNDGSYFNLREGIIAFKAEKCLQFLEKKNILV
jgi:hypothetical protein